MAQLPTRDLANEVRKHFKGTPEERVALAMHLGRESLKLFLATLPPGTTAAAAREILRRNKNRGRRGCRATETSG